MMKKLIVFLVLLSVALILHAATRGPHLECGISESAESPETLAIRVWHVYPSGSIPAPGARIELSASNGGSWNLVADLRGEALFPYREISSYRLNGGKVTLEAKASLGEMQADSRFKLDLDDIEGKIEAAAAEYSERGKTLAAKSDYAGAEKSFQKALSLDPGLNAARYNLALCREKAGDRHGAIQAYVEYLESDAEPEEELTIKLHVIDLDKTLPRLAIPLDAQADLSRAREMARYGNYPEAQALCEKLQRSCPWWSEPYYLGGLVAEQLGYHQDFEMIGWAADSYRLFLDSASLDDPRRVEVSERMERLRLLPKNRRARG